MNKHQRELLEGIKDKIDDLANEIRNMSEEEQEKFDNAPENLQQTETFQTIERIASNLDSAATELEQASSDIGEALSD